MKAMKLGFVLIGLTTLLALAGCGGGGDSSTSGTLTPGTGTLPGTIPNVTTSTVGSVELSSPSETNGLVASGSGTAASSTGVLRVTVLDQDSKPLAGQTVTFSPDAGTIAGTAVTDQYGKAQVSFTAPNTLGAIRISASAGGVQSNEISIDIKAGPAAVIDVYALPNKVGPSAASSIKAFVTDANGFPVVAGTTVTAKLASTSQSGASFFEMKATDATGLVTFTTYISGATTGTDTILVQTGAAVGSATISVTATASALASFTMSSGVAEITADGADFTTLRAVALDAANKPVSGVPVTFSTTLGTISAASTATDGSGVALATLTAGTVVGAAKVIARTDSGYASILQIPFVAGPPASVTLSVFPQSIKSGGTASAAAMVYDASNNPVGGETLTFVLDPTDIGKFAPISVGADASGRGASTYTAGSNPGTYELSVRTSNGIVPTTKPQVTVTSSDPASITLVATDASIALGGSTTLTVTVKDSLGAALPDIPVNFSTTLGSLVASGLTDANGQVKPSFGAGTTAGTATITATAGSRQATTTVGVTPGPGIVITQESVVPSTSTIHIKQSALDTTATLTYVVKDSYGNPVADGVGVTFALSGSGTGGGEVLSALAASTVAGRVTVTLTSGTVSGVVDIRASLTTAPTVSTISRINIVGAMPDAQRLSLSATPPRNLAGFVWDGLTSTVKGVVVDRFGNVPADGTVVTLYSSCGSIGTSGGFNTTTTGGVVTATFTTVASDKTRPECEDVQVVLATTGDESWNDANGNGLIDAGEACVLDLGDPYVDNNNNGSFDVGEQYIDADKNGAYSGPNGTCEQNKTIWTSAPLFRYTDFVANPGLTPSGAGAFTLKYGESQVFTYTLADLRGNALVAGTTVKVTTTAGTLTGPGVSFTMPDSVAPGQTYSFTLRSATTAVTPAKPLIAEVVLTITPPANANNNGAELKVYADGTIDNALP